MQFELLNQDNAARRGRMTFARGTVETPAFMPVGTYGTVKAMTPEALRGLGAELILGNTIHMLRPGTDFVKLHGDQHKNKHKHKPNHTDTNGFQVFSLGDLRKISERGVA